MSLWEIVSWPFSQLLLFFYNLTGNYGVALILFAIIIRIVMLPFQMKSKRSMMKTSRLGPQVKELEKKYAGNQQKYQEEVSRLYKAEKVNPMSGCLWMLLPFPILILLFTIIREPLSQLMLLSDSQVIMVEEYFTTIGMYAADQAGAYKEVALANLIHEHFNAVKEIVPNVIDIDFSFLWMNLGMQPDWTFFTSADWSRPEQWLPAFWLFLLPVVSAVFALIHTKITQKTTPQQTDQAGSMKMMTYMSPVISLIFGFQVPAALSVYWTAGSVLSIFQDLWLNKRYEKIMNAEDAERRARYREREEELERKRQETERLRLEGVTQTNRNTSRRKRQVKEKAKEEERQATIKASQREKTDTLESQVGERKYARGRAYIDDRYGEADEAPEDEDTELSASEDQMDNEDKGSDMRTGSDVDYAEDEDLN